MEVKTLREEIEERPVAWPFSKGCCVIASQQTSSIQFMSEDQKNYLECTVKNGKATVGKNVEPQLLEVCVAPARKNVRKGVLSLLRERFLNDVRAANDLLARLEKDGVIEDGRETSIKEVASCRDFRDKVVGPESGDGRP